MPMDHLTGGWADPDPAKLLTCSLVISKAPRHTACVTSPWNRVNDTQVPTNSLLSSPWFGFVLCLREDRGQGQLTDNQ